MSNREEYQHWLAEHKEDEAVEKYFDDRRTEKDTDTWEADMNRDAEQYKAGE